MGIWRRAARAIALQSIVTDYDASAAPHRSTKQWPLPAPGSTSLTPPANNRSARGQRHVVAVLASAEYSKQEALPCHFVPRRQVAKGNLRTAMRHLPEVSGGHSAADQPRRRRVRGTMPKLRN